MAVLVAPSNDGSSVLRRMPETVNNGPFGVQTLALWMFVLGPLAVVPVVGLWFTSGPVNPTVLDAAIGIPMYVFSGLGVTVGYHRYFTHRAFTANRPLRIVLAVAGAFAVEGSTSSWVAAHRCHHVHSDADGDPHSPWRFGRSPFAIGKGLIWAHVGWLFARRVTNVNRFASDIRQDRDLARVDAMFPLLVTLSLVLPAAVGGLVTMSWAGMVSAFIWAGLVRIFVLHHVTWATNSVCHVIGKRPFRTRDESRNVWLLSLVSFGESWHNAHHARPASARHGVDRGQIDISASVIRAFERFGWVTSVHWPNRSSLELLRDPPARS
jgi:stearoyl-CoA desaturase (delta-9 desaturase)